MLSRKSKARLGLLAALKLARSRKTRKATLRVGAPTAKAGARVGKVVAKRKARRHAGRAGNAARTALSLAVVYGPIAAEVLRLVEPPKPRRRAPVFAAGVVTGGVVAHLLTRRRGV
jgi:hypothetical protein